MGKYFISSVSTVTLEKETYIDIMVTDKNTKEKRKYIVRLNKANGLLSLVKI